MNLFVPLRLLRYGDAPILKELQMPLAQQYIDHGVPDVDPSDAETFLFREYRHGTLSRLSLPPQGVHSTVQERQEALHRAIVESGKHDAAQFERYSCPVLAALAEGHAGYQQECHDTAHLRGVQWNVILYYPHNRYALPKYAFHSHSRVRMLETAVISHDVLYNAVARWVEDDTEEALWLRLECGMDGNVTAEVITQKQYIEVSL